MEKKMSTPKHKRVCQKDNAREYATKKLSNLPKLCYSFLCSVDKRENKGGIQADMTGVDERKETG
jgi:hypothetical protein